MAVAAGFQRVGARSNAHAGSEFEAQVANHLGQIGLNLTPNFSVPVGNGSRTKAHRFDFGGEAPPVLVECKSHTWTAGGNSPSAKLTVWNEAMYYFALAPQRYRKIFCVLKDTRRGESLAEYYVRLYGHMIAQNVEIMELCLNEAKLITIFDAR